MKNKPVITREQLPAYALPYQPAHSGGERDVGAEFRGDDAGTIAVSIERLESPDHYCLCISRSGLGETCFNRNELARVLELAGILLQALKK